VFTFTNISRGSVTVTNIHPSCGCTTAKLPALPWTVAAGIVGRIELSVNIAGSSRFSRYDVKDAMAIVNQFAQQSSPLCVFLWQTMSESEQLLLGNSQMLTSNTNKTQDILVVVLNRMIEGPSIYEANRFKGIALRRETMSLVQENTTSVNAARLNRLLLEDAFPVELSRTRIAGENEKVVRSVLIGTDKGSKELTVQINILPVSAWPVMCNEQRVENLKIASVDREAVFRSDCASCHAKPSEHKFGRQLYLDMCSTLCHEGDHRATIVPDLHKLNETSSPEFWRRWISHGRSGTVMPAFAISDGGPLTDAQIDSLVDYISAAIPPKVLEVNPMVLGK
jgi:mono/diheme cytochrome c family protein